jgi:hypothetical protein
MRNRKEEFVRELKKERGKRYRERGRERKLVFQ